MEIALTIINLICFGGAWYFLGRSSIYYSLLKSYKEALTIIGKQQALIQAYEMKYNTEKTEEENGEQD
nr:MAG TPA: hypothetical protein [Caudoviricetes sp.]